MPIRVPSPFFLTQQTRTFASTTPLCAKSTKSKLRDDHKDVPHYPYGPSLWYKQSNHGLYGGARIQYGNNVSEKTELKTRRKWRPNVRYRNLFSHALDRLVRVRVSARVMRTIDKVGSLDNYLLGEKAARIRELGMGGWLLRWRIIQTPTVKERFRKQREQLGLPAETPFGDEPRGMGGEVVTKAQMEEQVRKYDAQLDKEGSTVPLSEADQEAVMEEGKSLEEAENESPKAPKAPKAPQGPRLIEF